MNWFRADDFVPQPRMAIHYAIGAIAFAIGAVFVGIWAIVPGWIALTLAIMAMAYMWLGPRVYGKNNGRIPCWVRVLLGPHVLGVFVGRRWQFHRMNRPFDRICDGVVLGRLLTDREAREVIASHDVTAVLDVCAEHSEPAAFRALIYHNEAVLDLAAPTTSQLNDAAKFIAAYAATGCVYVHCGIGKSRSAAVVAAYLLLHGNAASAQEACAFVQRVRPAVKFTLQLRQSLQALESARLTVPTATEAEVIMAVSRANSARW